MDKQKNKNTNQNDILSAQNQCFGSGSQKDDHFYKADNTIQTPPNSLKNTNGAGSQSPQDPDKDKKEKSSEIKIYDKNGQDKHIFKDKEGHLQDTPENRKLLIEIAKDRTNYLGTDKYGTQWYGKTLENGKQAWATVRNNLIRDGGINNSTRSFDKNTGLCNSLSKGKS